MLIVIAWVCSCILNIVLTICIVKSLESLILTSYFSFKHFLNYLYITLGTVFLTLLNIFLVYIQQYDVVILLFMIMLLSVMQNSIKRGGDDSWRE